jgi:hypothetical protein
MIVAGTNKACRPTRQAGWFRQAGSGRLANKACSLIQAGLLTRQVGYWPVL